MESWNVKQNGRKMTRKEALKAIQQSAQEDPKEARLPDSMARHLATTR